jgi:dinuclear metal center YbgI/SA1388 family protein
MCYVIAMPILADLVAFFRRFAPPDLAEEWDNAGLLVGDRNREVTRILTCLTLTPDVAREAIDDRASLVVTHHPVLFRPVKRLTADDPQGKMLLALIAAGVAVYSPHTSYDSADEGINEQLSRMLGLKNAAPLRPVPAEARCKIVSFVPRDSLAAVQEALWSVGAGTIGDYSKCSFVVDGAGTFYGAQGAHPAVGQAERLEKVAEARLEVICPERLVSEAIGRLRSAHPYEEPAFDIYHLRREASSRGAGRFGDFPAPAAGGNPARLADLLEQVKSRLNIPHLQYVGDLDRPVSRVGICCGSGAELLPAAIARRCDVFFTGEARFHSCLEARDAGIALVLAGHYATERPAMEHLANVLGQEFAGVAVRASAVERDPVAWS